MAIYDATATIKDKCIEYKKYIQEHKDNIMVAFKNYHSQICEALNVDSEELFQLVMIHDESKFDEEEFTYYRKAFYPAPYEKVSKDIIDYGWLHHIHNNPHHWNYWVITDSDGVKAIDMPNIYIAEMILDWIAMSIKSKSTALDWFNKNKSTMILSLKTKTVVQDILTKLFGGNK